MRFSLYGFLLGVGFVLFWQIFESLLRKQYSSDLENTQWFSGLALISFGALIGARFYHLWTDPQLYVEADLFELIAVWNGGLGIYGAVLGGLLGIFIWKKIAQIPLSWFSILDAAAIATPFGQAIGRWGNFVNQELFGLPTTLPWGVFIQKMQRPEEYASFTHFHPLFLYESLALFLLGAFLFMTHKKLSSLLTLGSGWYLGCYLFAYGTVRFCLEFLRPHSAIGWLELSIAQWFSVVALLLGILFFSKGLRNSIVFLQE